jgi:hypothetical protein
MAMVVNCWLGATLHIAHVARLPADCPALVALMHNYTQAKVNA